MSKVGLEVRPVGSQGLMAPCQGLGCMGMTAFYKDDALTSEEREAQGLATIDKALEMGINFLDTAWIYQDFTTGETNEALIAKAIKKHGRDKFVIATKFGILPSGVSGKREDVRKQCLESLERLGTDYIDLYYMHRMDRATPIEDTMGYLKELKDEGKIKYVGLSECSASEIRRAHAVLPISAIQMEWSLQTRDIETEIVPCARELGIAIVAYSPLGRGFLSQTFTKKDEIGEKDWRRSQPRFDDKAFEANAEAGKVVAEMAQKKGCTPAQLALAWVHAQGNDVFPIPGTKKASRIEENAKAVCVLLSKEEADELAKKITAVGDRYSTPMMAGTFQGGL